MVENIYYKMTNILVFSFILTDNIEKIVQIRVIKVSIKFQLIKELFI